METCDSDDLVSQPELFDRDPDIGRELLTIDEDRSAGKHTAAILSRREELAAAIMTRVLAGMSEREAAKLFRVGRNTIAALKRKWESEGKLEPLKRRLVAKLGRAVELGVENSIELLEKGQVPANVLPIMVGVFVEKRALLEGEPTAIVHQVKREITPDDLAKALDAIDVEASIVAPKALPLDSQSGVDGEKPHEK